MDQSNLWWEVCVQCGVSAKQVFAPGSQDFFTYKIKKIRKCAKYVSLPDNLVYQSRACGRSAKSVILSRKTGAQGEVALDGWALTHAQR